MKPRYDRRAIMKDAHRQWRASQRYNLGWDWAHCCRRAWEAAKGRAALVTEYHQPPQRKRADLPFPKAA